MTAPTKAGLVCSALLGGGPGPYRQVGSTLLGSCPGPYRQNVHEQRHAVMLLVLYVFTSAVADITVFSGVVSLLFLFSIWLDLRSVSPTINTYIQLVRHLLLFLFTGVVAADYELCPGINKPILKAPINKQTVQRDFLV